MWRTVSIFCGCGGLDWGFRQAGFALIYACDSDPAAVDAYRRNVDHRVFVRDVQSDEFHDDVRQLGSCEIVLGGFPCQGFSKAGPKLESDGRNKLYVEMKRAVASLRPKLFIAENVDGLSQNYRGAYLKEILSDFRQIGYEVDHRIVDSVSYGVPQHRRRIFFVGTREGCPRFKWPNRTHDCMRRNGEFRLDALGPSLFDREDDTAAARLLNPVPIGDAIGDLLDLDHSIPDHAITEAWPKKYEPVFLRIKEGQKLCNVRHAPTSVYTWEIPEVFGELTRREIKVLEAISRHRRHKRYGNVPNGNPLPIREIERLADVESIRPEIEALLRKRYLKEINGKYDLRGAMFCSGLFKRPRWDQPAPTVLTNFHNPRYFLHPKRDRPFSLRECARLQTFPDAFHFASEKVSLVDGYRLAGNAVPPRLSVVLADAVARFLDSKATIAL